MWGMHKNPASGVNPIPLGHPLWRFSEGRTDAIRKSNKTLVTSVRIPWLTADDRAEFRQGLETSMRNGRDAVQIIHAWPWRVSPDVKGLRGKLVVLATLVESHLKTPL
jgi:hypothetical protein